MDNPVTRFDFTCKEELFTEIELQKLLHKHCKKWCFQLEEGKTGYRHYQGRISLKMKKRLKQLPNIIGTGIRYSITSNANRNNDFYVLKDETRLKGPWKDEEYQDVYIPRQIREISKLWPWQQEVIDTINDWDTRSINVIYDNEGNKGKSILKTYIRCHRLGRVIPFCNNYKDILRMVCDMPTSKMYLIDMPRAVDKEKLGSLYSAIETIKDGYAYDDRYKFTEKMFDCPIIWIFTNVLPDCEYFTNDRWKFYTINKALKLEEYEESLGATL